MTWNLLQVFERGRLRFALLLNPFCLQDGGFLDAAQPGARLALQPHL